VWHQEHQAVVINKVGIAKGSVLVLVSQVRDTVLMNVYLVGEPQRVGILE
jgi:hypothetical protein